MVWSSREVARVLLVLLLQQLDRGDGPLIFGSHPPAESNTGERQRQLSRLTKSLANWLLTKSLDITWVGQF